VRTPEVVAPEPVGQPDWAQEDALPMRPWPLLGLYIRRHLRLSTAAFLAVVGGAFCAVAAQYGLKLLVDRMASSTPGSPLLPLALCGGLFLSLLAAENACWRLGGWLGSRAIIRIGADLRLDLFDNVTRQTWRFFAGKPRARCRRALPLPRRVRRRCWRPSFRISSRLAPT
jgi:ATP-binding cassette subfamily B protein